MFSVSDTYGDKSFHYVTWGPGAAFINCTPHDITVFARPEDKEGYVVPVSGFVARAGEQRIERGQVCGIPLYEMVYDSQGGSQPADFPVSSTWAGENVEPVYIVSLKFIQTLGAAYKEYPTLYTPGPAKRDENGNTVGCLGLCRHVIYKYDPIYYRGTPEPDWALAPSWANWHAYDEDGTGWWFEGKPTLESNYWNNPGGVAKREGYFKIDFAWWESVRERPQEGEE